MTFYIIQSWKHTDQEASLLFFTKLHRSSSIFRQQYSIPFFQRNRDMIPFFITKARTHSKNSSRVQLESQHNQQTQKILPLIQNSTSLQPISQKWKTNSHLLRKKNKIHSKKALNFIANTHSITCTENSQIFHLIKYINGPKLTL